MPITVQVPLIEHVPNGVTTVFSYPFAILAQEDLKAKLDGVDYTAFTVSGVGNRSGGSITCTAAPTGSSLILYREVSLDRATDYQELGDLMAETLDDDFDRVWMALQDQLLTASRALRAPVGETFDELPASNSRALRVLGFDSNGAPIMLTRTDDGGAALALDLANASDASKGPGMIGFGSTLNYVAGTLGHAMQSRGLTVRDFWEDGDVDWAPASRRALDNAAAGSGAGIGGRVFYSPGVYSIPTTVYIPRSNAPIKIYGHGAVIVGSAPGTGTIFETAQGTTSTGATSSFGTNELYLHYNTQIQGLYFKDCEYALKLNNFLQGCVVKACGAITGVKTLVYARRCFYLNVLNNFVLTSYDPAVTSDTDACYRFEDNNNGMVIQGNSALRSATTKGTGFYFSAGTAAVQFTGNTAERCNKGLYIGGAVYSMGVRDNYFEGNTLDISVEDGNYKRGLEIDANWFKSAKAIEAVAWESGELGPNNHYNGSGSVTINSSLGADGSLNSLVVYLPRQMETETTHRSAAVIPVNWLLNGSIIVKRQFSTYLNATGPSASRHALATEVLGGTQIIPRHWVGRSNLRTSYSDGGVPFATVTDNTAPGPGTIVIDTQLAWDTREMGARFDFYISDSGGNHQLGGWVNGTTVFRDDASAKTITAAVNGSSNLQLTLSSFTVATIRGGVRIL